MPSSEFTSVNMPLREDELDAVRAISSEPRVPGPTVPGRTTPGSGFLFAPPRHPDALAHALFRPDRYHMGGRPTGSPKERAGISAGQGDTLRYGCYAPAGQKGGRGRAAPEGRDDRRDVTPSARGCRSTSAPRTRKSPAHVRPAVKGNVSCAGEGAVSARPLIVAIASLRRSTPEPGDALTAGRRFRGVVDMKRFSAPNDL
jgi:hypothetical protein